MIWTIDKEPVDGIMFRGESSVRVTNRRGETGRASVQYQPYCGAVGPVVEDVETDEEGFPLREAQVIDRRPTFRS